MPQLTLEHSANLELQRCVALDQLLGRLHRVLHDVGGIDLAKCKSRAVSREDFVVGDGNPSHAFVHLEARLLDGRPPELRQRIGEALVALLTDALTPFAGGFALQVTVELVEMPQADYFKATLGQPVA